MTSLIPSSGIFTVPSGSSVLPRMDEIIVRKVTCEELYVDLAFVGALAIDVISEVTPDHGVYVDGMRIAEDTIGPITMASIQPVGAPFNVVLGLIPKGQGAIVTSVPDGVTGGNARGNYANDFQRNRVLQTSVASGISSVICGGYDNTASGDYSAVVGGDTNSATQQYAFVGAGTGNVCSASWAAIAAGTTNTNDGANSFIGSGSNNFLGSAGGGIVCGETNSMDNFSTDSFIGGGATNAITAANAVIGGGEGNAVSAIYGAIVGGRDNAVSGIYSSAVGGQQNSASGAYSWIGGGFGNIASGYESVVAGGETNTASGQNAAILGGFSNTATSTFSAVIFGSQCDASGASAIVVGGVSNTCAGQRSFVGGGNFNNCAATWSVIAGGDTNVADGTSQVISGGVNNTIAGPASSTDVISGGDQNLIRTLTAACTIAGGRGNIIGDGVSAAQYATIGGGRDCLVFSNYGYAHGRQAQSLHDGATIMNDATGTPFTSNAAHQFAGRFSGGWRFVGGVASFNDRTEFRSDGFVTTVGATTATLYTIPVVQSFIAKIAVNGYDVAAGSQWVAVATVRAKNVAGLVTVGAAFDTWDDGDFVGTLAASAAGTDMIIEVTGDVGVTVDWTGTVWTVL